jgi:hypothetical protein
VPFATEVESKVHSAGAVAEAARMTLLRRNSIRVMVPVAVARKVTSPVAGEVPLTWVTVTAGPFDTPARPASKSSNVTAPANFAIRARPA